MPSSLQVPLRTSDVEDVIACRREIPATMCKVVKKWYDIQALASESGVTFGRKNGDGEMDSVPSLEQPV